MYNKVIENYCPCVLWKYYYTLRKWFIMFYSIFVTDFRLGNLVIQYKTLFLLIKTVSCILRSTYASVALMKYKIFARDWHSKFVYLYIYRINMNRTIQYSVNKLYFGFSVVLNSEGTKHHDSNWNSFQNIFWKTANSKRFKIQTEEIYKILRWVKMISNLLQNSWR